MSILDNFQFVELPFQKKHPYTFTCVRVYFFETLTK